MKRLLSKIYNYPLVQGMMYPMAGALGMVGKKSIRIDGGMGAQIIGYMMYRANLANDPSYTCDVSFFLRAESDPVFLSEVTFREWRLDYYGISLDSLTNQAKTKWRIYKNIDDQGKDLLRFFRDDIWKTDWSAVFPVSAQTEETMLGLNILPDMKYTVIHLRRGDFLRFSSLLVTDEQLKDILYRLRKIITARIIIVSDDPVDEKLYTWMQEEFATHQITCMTGGDEIIVHAIMRRADVLFTANSMFSLSAALLQKKGGVAVLPGKFFGKKFTFHNEAILALSQWGILSGSPHV